MLGARSSEHNIHASGYCCASVELALCTISIVLQNVHIQKLMATAITATGLLCSSLSQLTFPQTWSPHWWSVSGPALPRPLELGSPIHPNNAAVPTRRLRIPISVYPLKWRHPVATSCNGVQPPVPPVLILRDFWLIFKIGWVFSISSSIIWGHIHIFTLFQVPTIQMDIKCNFTVFDLLKSLNSRFRSFSHPEHF